MNSVLSRFKSINNSNNKSNENNTTKLIINPNTSENIAFAVLPNCNATDKCINWLGPINNFRDRGCGINVLRFMEEININDAKNKIEEIQTEYNKIGIKQVGSPFSWVVKFFNDKNQDKTYEFIESTYDIENNFLDSNQHKLISFFDTIQNNIPDNSCILVKFCKYKFQSDNIGHYMLLSKEKEKLFAYDPIKSKSGSCKKYEYVKTRSFYSAYESYNSVSFLCIQNTISTSSVSNSETSTLENYIQEPLESSIQEIPDSTIFASEKPYTRIIINNLSKINTIKPIGIFTTFINLIKQLYVCRIGGKYKSRRNKKIIIKQKARKTNKKIKIER